LATATASAVRLIDFGGDFLIDVPPLGI
jgi:hypothetical protein